MSNQIYVTRNNLFMYLAELKKEFSDHAKYPEMSAEDFAALIQELFGV